jgi:uncharacterized protein (DUF885 family)
LHQLFDEEWERGLRENPVNASYQGDKRYNDRWSDASLAAIEASQAADRKALERIRAIDRTALAPADQLNYDTFLWLQEKAVERQKFRTYLQPISHQGGVQTLDGIAEILPFATTKDYRDWLKRMDAIPVVVEQTIALMREGVKAGSMPPKVLMQRVPRQIAAQIVEDPTQSPFYGAFQKFRYRPRRSGSSATASCPPIARCKPTSTTNTCRRRANRSLPQTCPTARRITTTWPATTRQPL